MTTDIDAANANIRNLERQLREAQETLRDQIAMRAMQGIIANSDPRCAPYTYEQCAQWAYQVADAMLKERSK